MTTLALEMTAEKQSGIEKVFKGFSRNLLSFIRKRVNDAGDAEDILQDVFERYAVTSVGEPIEKAATWLFTVARNRITDYYRKQKPERLISSSAEGEVDEEKKSVLNSFENSVPNLGEQSLLTESMREIIVDALDDLPEQQRIVFIRHEIEGISFEQMSRETGISINTLLSRKAYAVKALRKRLTNFYEETLN